MLSRMVARMNEREKRLKITSEAGACPIMALLPEVKKAHPYKIAWAYSQLMYAYGGANDTWALKSPLPAHVLAVYLYLKNSPPSQDNPDLTPALIMGGVMFANWGAIIGKIQNNEGIISRDFWTNLIITQADVSLIVSHIMAKRAEPCQATQDDLTKLSATFQVPADSLTEAHAFLQNADFRGWPDNLFVHTNSWGSFNGVIPDTLAVVAQDKFQDAKITAKQKKCLVLAMSLILPHDINSMVKVATFSAAACTVKSGSMTPSWLSSRWSRLKTSLSKPEYFSELEHDPNPAGMHALHDSFFVEADDHHLIGTIFSIHHVLAHFNEMESLQWVLQQSKAQNLAPLSAIAEALVNYPSLLPSRLEGLPHIKEQLVIVCSALCAAISQPFCAIKRPPYPAAQYADLAYICTQLVYTRSNNTGNLMGMAMSNYQGTHGNRAKNPLPMLDKIVEDARAHSKAMGATVLDITTIAARRANPVIKAINDPMAFFEVTMPQGPAALLDLGQLSTMLDTQLALQPNIRRLALRDILTDDMKGSDKAITNLARKYLERMVQDILPDRVNNMYTLPAIANLDEDSIKDLTAYGGYQALKLAPQYEMDHVKPLRQGMEHSYTESTVKATTSR